MDLVRNLITGEIYPVKLGKSGKWEDASGKTQYAWQFVFVETVMFKSDLVAKKYSSSLNGDAKFQAYPLLSGGWRTVGGMHLEEKDIYVPMRLARALGRDEIIEVDRISSLYWAEKGGILHHRGELEFVDV